MPGMYRCDIHPGPSFQLTTGWVQWIMGVRPKREWDPLRKQTFPATPDHQGYPLQQGVSADIQCADEHLSARSFAAHDSLG